uniref:DHC_N1 domain-containing protein n=1 Tax=Hymenolepis diminuta TaxID=6216 RepID=A0A0R3SKX6_HYMDI
LTANTTMNDYNVEAEFQDFSSLFGTNCHNLIDICLGPVDFYSDVAIYKNEELAHVARLVKEVFDPNPVLKYVNDSMESLTMEIIQGIKDVSKRFHFDT